VDRAGDADREVDDGEGGAVNMELMEAFREVEEVDGVDAERAA
jgi:hypothetical protein